MCTCKNLGVNLGVSIWPFFPSLRAPLHRPRSSLRHCRCCRCLRHHQVRCHCHCQLPWTKKNTRDAAPGPGRSVVGLVASRHGKRRLLAKPAPAPNQLCNQLLRGAFRGRRNTKRGGACSSAWLGPSTITHRVVDSRAPHSLFHRHACGFQRISHGRDTRAIP